MRNLCAVSATIALAMGAIYSSSALAVNDAPLLDNTGTMILTGIAEDTTDPAGDTVAVLGDQALEQVVRAQSFGPPSTRLKQKTARPMTNTAAMPLARRR